jgi:endonuclease YncB( thermonuclease family)
MAAMPQTPTFTPPVDAPTLTFTPELYTPTPEINFAAPGAYCIPTTTERRRALVTRVLNGDTIEVAIDYGTLTVVYLGIDAPEITAPGEWKGGQAAAKNTSLVEGKHVTLIRDVTDIDANGRYPRYVMVDSIFVNYDMLVQGLAKVDTHPPDTACEIAFNAAQTEAMVASRGVWEPTPIPTSTVTPTATNTSIPTNTRRAPCTCRPGLSCNNFFSQRQAQECYEYCLDAGYGPILNDGNRNGLVCEGLP